VVRADHHVAQRIHVIRKVWRGLHHTDHGHGRALHLQLLADDGRARVDQGGELGLDAVAFEADGANFDDSVPVGFETGGFKIEGDDGFGHSTG